MENLPFMSASYLAIHEVTTVSLLRPSISGSMRIFFSLWCLKLENRSSNNNAVNVSSVSVLKYFSTSNAFQEIHRFLLKILLPSI